MKVEQFPDMVFVESGINNLDTKTDTAKFSQVIEQRDKGWICAIGQKTDSQLLVTPFPSMREVLLYVSEYATQELLLEIRRGIELRASAMNARLFHGQFLGGTFDSSQRVSSPLYFRQLQSTGGSGSRHRSPGRMKFTLDSFTKIDGIVVSSQPLESEDSAHFDARIRTDCLGDCCCIPGPEIAIPRWTDSD